MKKMRFILPLAGSLLMGFNMVLADGSTHKTVPGAVVETFNSLYPSLNEVVWEKKSGGFEADFVVNNRSMSMVFRKDGKLIDSKLEITDSELPANVLASLKRDYLDNNYKILYVMKKDSKGIESYEMEITKGRLLYIVRYDKEGNATNKYVINKLDIMNVSNNEGGF
jgi:hypothetical protein